MRQLIARRTMSHFVRPFCVIVITALVFQGNSRAEIALTLNSPGELASPQLFTLGWEFTVSSPIEVTELGKYLLNDNTTLSQASLAGIWLQGGELLASVTIPTTTQAVLDAAGQKVVFQALSTAIILQPGNSYRIGVEEFSGGDPYGRTNDGLTASAIAASPINLGVGVFTQHPVGFAYPETSFGLPGQNYFGPNMEFSTLASVPEPNSLVLLLTGAAAIFGLTVRRNF